MYWRWTNVSLNVYVICFRCNEIHWPQFLNSLAGLIISTAKCSTNMSKIWFDVEFLASEQVIIHSDEPTQMKLTTWHKVHACSFSPWWRLLKSFNANPIIDNPLHDLPKFHLKPETRSVLWSLPNEAVLTTWSMVITLSGVTSQVFAHDYCCPS